VKRSVNVLKTSSACCADTTPLQTAIVFITFVFGMDFFVVALLINRSLEMFTSLLGTWLPFVLIFTSTWLTGTLTKKHAAWKSARKRSTQIWGKTRLTGFCP